MKRILVIDDDYDIGEIVQMALSQKYKVLARKDANDLLEVINSFKPDLMLIDNYVGHTRASDIISEIRSLKLNNAIPFVLFSAHQDVANIAKQLNANSYISKPFGLSDLHSRIEEVLSR